MQLISLQKRAEFYSALSKEDSGNQDEGSEQKISGEMPREDSEAKQADTSFWDYRIILTRKSCLIILFISFLQTHNNLFDGFLPTFIQAEDCTSNRLESHSILASILPLGCGLGISSSTTAIYLTVQGVSSTVFQVFLYPPVVKRLGTLRALRFTACMIPLVYLLMPYTTKVPAQSNNMLLSSCLIALQLIKALCTTLIFPCSQILLSNSISDKRLLGKLNGISSSASQLSRALGSWIVGKLFEIGLRDGMIGLPWWAIAGFSFGGFCTAFLLRDSHR